MNNSTTTDKQFFLLIISLLFICFTAVKAEKIDNKKNLFPAWSLNQPSSLYKSVDSISKDGPTAACYYCSVHLLNKTDPDKKKLMLSFRERKKKGVEALDDNVKISIDTENKFPGSTASIRIDTTEVNFDQIELLRLAVFGPAIIMQAGKRYKLTLTMKADRLYFPVKSALIGNYIPKGRIKEKTFYDFKKFILEPLWMDYSLYVETPRNSQQNSAKTNFVPIDIKRKGVFWIGKIQVSEE